MSKAFDEIKKMDQSKLHDELKAHKKNVMNLRFQKSSGQLEKTHGFRQSRRSVARIKTLLTQISSKEKSHA